MEKGIYLPGYLERTSVLDFVGAASSRDRFNSRLEAAPTGVFFSYLSLPDKRIYLFQAMGEGLHRCPSSMATRPHPSQTNFIAASLSLHIWADSVAGSPQKLHFALSPQGSHRCPGSSATAPQFLHV